MKNLWTFLRHREWAATIGVLAVVADSVQRSISEEGVEPPHKVSAVLLLVMAAVIRSGVFSKKTANEMLNTIPPQGPPPPEAPHEL